MRMDIKPRPQATKHVNRARFDLNALDHEAVVLSNETVPNSVLTQEISSIPRSKWA